MSTELYIEILVWVQMISEKILLIEVGIVLGLFISLAIKKYEGPPIKVMYETDIDSFQTK